jgi:hypothetical protein
MSVWFADQLIVIGAWLVGLVGTVAFGYGSATLAWSMFALGIAACLRLLEVLEGQMDRLQAWVQSPASVMGGHVANTPIIEAIERPDWAYDFGSAEVPRMEREGQEIGSLL